MPKKNKDDNSKSISSNINDEIKEEDNLSVTGNQSISSQNNELEDLKKKCEEYLFGWQRAKADYLNFKRESEKQKQEFLQFANAGLLADLIPIYDNFKKAFNYNPKNEDKEWKNWQVGIGHIKNQLWEFIKRFGIEEIKTVGQKFDPNFHESVESKKDSGKESLIILEEVAPGYTLQGKVVTVAKVIVAE